MNKIIDLLVLAMLLLSSCQESKKENITQLVSEWMGSKIVYPEDLTFTLWGNDTVVDRTPYTIVTYADSVGCISCKLQLANWLTYLAEIKEQVPEKVKVHFIFHPKDPKELAVLLKQNKFNYPVCIDENDSFNKLNHLSSIMAFQTFLLNKDNEVIAIGNPIYNPKIKEFYMDLIKDGAVVRKEHNELRTEIAINSKTVTFGTFSWHDEQTASLVLTNIGKNPLVIQDVATSCGCFSVEYSTEPVRPGKDLNLKITYKADNPEHFNKTITVYCNAETSPLHVKISGNAE